MTENKKEQIVRQYHIGLTENNVLYGQCFCGCSQKTKISTLTSIRDRQIKGFPLKYIHGHNQKGDKHYAWRGGRSIVSTGENGRKEVFVLSHGHRSENSSGYVREHILVAEKALGKSLPPDAVIHHINGNSSDNRPQNLVICENNGYHRFLHGRLNAYRKGKLKV